MIAKLTLAKARSVSVPLLLRSAAAAACCADRFGCRLRGCGSRCGRAEEHACVRRAGSEAYGLSTRHATELERGRFVLEEVRALKVRPRTSCVVRGGPVILVRTFLGVMRRINLRASSAPA